MLRKRLARLVLVTLPLLVAACSDGRLPLVPDAPRSDGIGVAADPAQGVFGVVDDFAGSVIDTDRWSLVGPESWVAQDDRLIVRPAPGTPGTAGLRFRLPALFTGRALSAEISQIATGSSTTETYLSVITLDVEEFVIVSSLGGVLTVWYKERGKSARQLGSAIAFNPASQRFRRIREQNGTLFVEVSADGQSWTRPGGWEVAGFFTTPGALYGNLGVRERAVVDGNPTPAVFENVNTTVPAIPSHLAATAVSSSEIHLSWQDRSVNEQGFHIERRIAGGSFEPIQTVGANVTSHQDGGLQPGTTYEYRVRAFNASGPSAYTNTAGATTQPPSGPSPPDLHTLVDDFAGTVIDNTRWAYYGAPSRTRQHDRLVVTLTPGVAGYGGLIYALPHRFSSTALTVEVSQVAGGGPLTETFIGVTSEDEEEYAVISSLNGMVGAYAKWRGEGWFRYRLGVELPYDPVAHRFRRIREQNGTVHYELSADGINWTQPPGWSVAHGFTSLDILHGALGAGAFVADPNAGTAVFENVNTTVPAIPSSLAATSVSSSRIDLDWQDRSVNEQGFQIQRRAGGGAWSPITTTGPNVTSHSDPGLQEATSYSYRVRAFNASGGSAWSNEATGVTRPAAPSNLVAVAVSGTRIDLSWQDNSNGEQGYQIYRATSRGLATLIGTVGPDVTGFSDPGLQPGSTYFYGVVAFNAGGQSEPSNPASARTHSP
jgi:hypothetical protein